MLIDSLRSQVLQAQRSALIDARDRGELDDEVLRSELEARDMDEVATEERVRRLRSM